MSNSNENLSMIQKYFKCYVENKKYGKIVQFLRCGSFFEIYGLFDVDKNEYYGTDIDKIAKILDYRVSNKRNRKKAKIDLSDILDYDTKINT